MPTYQKCEPGRASGTHKPRITAAYGMQRVMTTIAPADQTTKPVMVAPPVWVYRRGAAGQGFVKGAR
jgi:hypothetical protein